MTHSLADELVADFVVGMAAIVIAKSREAHPDSTSSTVMTIVDTLARWVKAQEGITNEQLCGDLLYSLDEF